MDSEILVFGASGHAKVILDILRAQGRYLPIGFVDRDLPPGSEFCGLPVLCAEEGLEDLVRIRGVGAGVIAVGDNFVRRGLALRVQALVPEFRWITAVHPRATLADDVVLGAGSVVMAGAVVNSQSVIGEGCILNTGCLVDHDAQIGDYASLAPGSVLGGGVTIGEVSAVGLGAKIIHGVRIGAHAVVGAGALVLDDVGDLELHFGMPAKFVRQRHEGEKYL